MIESLESRIALTGGLNALDALNAKLAEFAADKTTPPAAVKVPTLLTAKADDVVFAVYQLTLTPDFDDATEVSDLVKTALAAQTAGTSTTLKARADINKIASRILHAALLGSGLDAAADVGQILMSVADVNAGNTRTQLSVAGKEAVVGEALKMTSGSDAFVGQAIADLANTLSSAVPGLRISAETKLRTFSTAAIKAAGTATGEVRSFTNELLTMNVNASTRANFTTLLAEGVVKIPNAAGAVFGAYADTLTDETEAENATLIGLRDTKLQGAISAIVAGTASASVVGEADAFAEKLVTDLGVKATTAVRAAIASGAIQAINLTMGHSSVDDVITAVLAPGAKVLTKAELATFAGGAAVGTGDSAADVVTKVSTLAADPATNGANVTTLTSVGVAVLKAIASSSPSSGKAVAAALIEANPETFPTNLSLTTLAKGLAKGLPTSGPTVGAAVAGVATELEGGNATPDDIAALGASVFPSASKATLDIARELSGLLTTTDYKEFAALMAGKVGVTYATAPNMAAGVAVTAALGNLDPSLHETPADIAVAVAVAADSLGRFPYQPKLPVIAGAVALAVDPERIAFIGGQVAAQYQNTGSTGTLPKLTAIGTLATSLAKAINTKLLLATADRVDELGELAAELTRAAITVLGPNATTAQLVSTISYIGTSVMKGLSAALLINGGPLAADLKDATRDIAGAIAQTISVIGFTDPALLSDAKVNDLLKTTGANGKLVDALNKQAKKFGGDALLAFDDVARAKPNHDFSPPRLVPGAEALGVGEVATGTSGRYEIGSLIDPVLPFASAP